MDMKNPTKILSISTKGNRDNILDRKYKIALRSKSDRGAILPAYSQKEPEYFCFTALSFCCVACSVAYQPLEAIW